MWSTIRHLIFEYNFTSSISTRQGTRSRCTTCIISCKVGTFPLVSVKKFEQKQWGREHFVPRLALEIQRSISGWDLPSWLPSLLNFTNILASLARSRGSPNIHKVLKNDSKRKENVQKGSPVVFTTQNSLKVLRIESVVPRFLLFPAITFPSQNEQNRMLS